MSLGKRGWMGLCWLLMVVLLLGAGCSDTEPAGDKPDNKAPVVNIVNIPPNESFFTQNPEIFWYGTDIDGYIIAYEYLVVRTDSLVDIGIDPTDESSLRAFAAESTNEWLEIDVNSSEGSPTRQRIKLFAGEDPDLAVEQVFFVRAVDDDDARSDVDFRLYSRSNHPPDTKISISGGSTVFWNLADTTSSYKGISISWEGSDDLDFGDGDTEEPTFEYYFQLFGPYPYLDTTDLAGTVDTLNMSKLIATGIDTASGSNWLTTEGVSVFNLFRNEPPSDTTRSGWFVAKATARDDAFVPDPTPAYVAFKAIDPHFENELLVSLRTAVATTAALGAIRETETYKNPDGSLTTIYPLDSLINYMQDAFTEAGYGDATFITPRSSSTALSRDLLAHYRNVVIFDEGASEGRRGSAMSTALFNQLAEYMDLGGNVWIWAPSPLVAFTSMNDPGFTGFTAQDMPVKYFDVKGTYVANWGSPTYTRWYFSVKCEGDTCMEIPANDQFIRALAIQGKGFSDLIPDLSRLNIYVEENSDSIPYHYRGVPGTCYFSRDLFSEPLFLFDSYYGDFVPDSLKEYVESLQGRVCGLRYNARTFKSAIFGFSWYVMPREDVVAVIEKMMTWFNE